MVSGEPVPLVRRVGDHLIGASVNGAGSVLMRAERVGKDTLLAQIVQMVAEALAALRHEGLEVVMLTGDNPLTAQALRW